MSYSDIYRNRCCLLCLQSWKLRWSSPRLPQQRRVDSGSATPQPVGCIGTSGANLSFSSTAFSWRWRLRCRLIVLAFNDNYPAFRSLLIREWEQHVYRLMITYIVRSPDQQKLRERWLSSAMAHGVIILVEDMRSRLSLQVKRKWSKTRVERLIAFLRTLVFPVQLDFHHRLFAAVSVSLFIPLPDPYLSICYCMPGFLWALKKSRS